MNLLELIKKRCSVRKYAPTPVEKEKIDYILEAARLAPSAVNRQPWYFLLVTEQAGCEKIYACYSREWIQTAKSFIVVCGDHAQSWKRAGDDKDHVDVDAAIATEHICLAAAEQGLAPAGSATLMPFVSVSCLNCPTPLSPSPSCLLAIPIRPTHSRQTPKSVRSCKRYLKENLSNRLCFLLRLYF